MQLLRRYTLFIIIVVACVSACKNSIDKENDIVNFTINDSLSKWIKTSKNRSYSSEIRKKNILKSFDIVSNIKNDSLKSNCLSKLSWASYTLKDSLLFRKINRKSIAFAKKINDSIVLAESYWDLGLFLKNNGVPDSAFYHYREAQKLYTAMHDDLNSGILLTQTAGLQADIGDYTGAEITGIQALEVIKLLNNDKALRNSYNQLGIITKNLNELDKALEYYTKSYENSNTLNNKGNLHHIYLNNTGLVYKEQGNYRKAIQNFKQVISADSLIHKNPSLYAKALTNLALTKLKQRDTSNVYDLLKESIPIKNRIKDIESVAASYYYISEYFLQKKDTIQAISFAKKAEESAIASTNTKRLLKTWQHLGKLEPYNSVVYTQRYIVLSDSLQQAERQIRNKFARIRFETKETEAENLLLAQQRQMWIGIAVGLLALAVSIFVIIAQRIKNQRLKFERKQQENNQEIFNLLLAQGDKLEEGKKSEQKRISEELHDSIIGQIMGSRLILASLNKKSDIEAIEKRAEIINQLKDVEAEVRTISHELSNAAYQKIYNFTSAVQELLDRISDSAQIKCMFNYDSSIDWDSIKGNQKINIYRIVQESLQNSVKHSECSTLTVDFKINNNKIIVKISDDGIGFTPKKGKQGIGLRNIISRVKKINGQFDIKSKKGKGTIIYLEVPIKVSLNQEQVKPLAKGA